MSTDRRVRSSVARSVLDETRLKIVDAVKLIPGRSGEHITRQTLRRWGLVGMLVNGQRVKLEMWRLGSTWWTSKEALDRWFAATNPVAEEPVTPAGA